MGQEAVLGLEAEEAVVVVVSGASGQLHSELPSGTLASPECAPASKVAFTGMD